MSSRQSPPKSAGQPVATAPSRPRPGFPLSLGQLVTPATGAAKAQRAAVAPQAAIPAPSGIGLDSSAVRQAMVARLAAQGLRQPEVLQALSQVERHRFVDSAFVHQAYEDTSLPIGLGQTISKPSVVARMLELGLGGREGRPRRVLEIGTGCGYQAALLSRLAHEVYSIERLRALHEKARDNLRHLRLRNLHLMLGDGMLGYPAGAGYDLIICAAGGHLIPQAWLDQLAPGGRLVTPAEQGHGHQHLVLIERAVQGFIRTVLEAVHFVPLKSGIA
jgi:protein-L-isoaspartate(D-aspartate) O-methyltransferase